MAMLQTSTAQACRARGGVGFAVSKRIAVSDPTPFGAPTARIAPPRRDLPIRRAEAWIAKGLKRVCSFLSGDPPEGFNEDPASPISGKNTATRGETTKVY